MRFGFSTILCPGWSFEAVAAKAVEHGYAGVELNADRTKELLNAGRDPVPVRDAFRQSGIGICSMDSGLLFVDSSSDDRKTAETVRRTIDLAQMLRCPTVIMSGAQVRHRANRSSTAVALGDWLLPLGDHAAERGVKLVVENAHSFRLANEMWLILDRLTHPAIACCWNVSNAAVLNESPAVSVPMLNSKIALVHLDGTAVGDAAMKLFFTRMQGIGYSGWLVYSPIAVADADEAMAGTIKALQELANSQVKAKPKPVVKPAVKKPVTVAGGTSNQGVS